MEKCQTNNTTSPGAPTAMDFVKCFLNDMRAKTVSRQQSSAPNSDIASAITQFLESTGNAFMVNFDIIKPATRPSTVRNKYAPLIGCTDARILINLRRDFQGVKTAFHRAMSGVVVKYPEWEIISIMPEAVESNANMQYIRDNWDDYHVFPVRDATNATLYYDEEWRISTYNGIDSSDNCWLGEKTYKTAIAELLEMHPEFSMGKLSKTRVYTVAFHHPHFHPLTAEGPSIELIQSVDLADLAALPLVGEDIGIPTSKPLIGVTYDQIQAARDTALSDFLADNTNRKYGFLLRRKSSIRLADAAAEITPAAAATSATDAASRVFGSGNGRARRGRGVVITWLPTSETTADYIIESKLLMFIRRTVYDLPRGPDARVQLFTPQDRVDYFCIQASLSKPDICAIFMRLFPQYADKYAAHNALIQTLHDKLIAAIGCNGGDIAAGRPRGTDPLSILTAEVYDSLTVHQLNINSAQTSSIVMDYLRNSDNLVRFYRYFKSIRTA